MANTIDTFYRVKKSLIEQYRKNGHIRINNVCSQKEISYFRQIINEAVATRKKNMHLLPMNERDTYGKAFLQVMNLWVDNTEIARFVKARRFASLAAQLLGVHNVRIYHDQALYKEPNSGLTPWHQDQHYWPLETDKCITLWMPLIDISQQMGTLNFASGSANTGYLGDIPISDNSEKYLAKLCADNNYNIVNYGDMKAGDATFHAGWCLHGAAENTTGTTREAMTIIWFADGTFIIPDPDPKNRWNKSRWDDMQRWLPDRKPGDAADGKFTPLVCPYK